MRTTLTIDDDNAAILDRLREEQRKPLKELVNQALRLGLRELQSDSARPKKPFQMPTGNLGKCLLPSLDNIEEVLDYLDGPMRR